MSALALATTVHDPDGKLIDAIVRDAAALKSVFDTFAINITDATRADVAQTVERVLGALVIRHKTGECPIAKARKDAVALALTHARGPILHSDFDHVIRWIEDKPDELKQVVASKPEVAFLVVGRSAKAFASGPKRLQETEKLVNHIYFLMTGHDWDLMFAVRRLSQDAAKVIVEKARAHDFANDVEWPLIAQEHGLSLDYAAADGLTYRTMDNFAAQADTHDSEPMEWIRRVHIADEHAQTMAHFLKNGRFSGPTG